MDQSTSAVRLARWASIVQQCQSRPKGQTIAQWLDERGINVNNYFYWQRRVRREVYHQLQASTDLPVRQESGDVSFFEIPVAQGSGASVPQNFHTDAVLETGNMTIRFSNSVSPELLAGIMEAVRHAR